MTTGNLVLHCGGEVATAAELDLVPIPAATESYQPVGHGDITKFLKTLGGDLLTGYHLARESYGLAREGQRFFGVHVYQNDNANLGLAVGFRNSYDKSMSLGIVLGAAVFVCDNLALKGDVSIMRKHTQNVWAELETVAIACFYRATKTFHEIEAEADLMRQRALSDREASQLLGVLYGSGILTIRQLPVALSQWQEPSHLEFQPRTAWSLYNGCTHALKSSPPVTVMNQHTDLHDCILTELGIYEVSPTPGG